MAFTPQHYDLRSKLPPGSTQTQPNPTQLQWATKTGQTPT
eukprot:05087.XXX_105138_105257_1 [CDS] Oithona nana genome sequencing.